MAFLDNSGDIILDAVLTDTGRYRLAQGNGSFKITKFALGDDEINYGSYNKTHTSGSAYYDLEIMQTPILEAFTNNTTSMKSKLLSIARTNLLYLPVLMADTTDTVSKQSGSVYAVAVDDSTVGKSGTEGFLVGTAANVVTTYSAGILNGFRPGGAGANNLIRVSQGLNTNEIGPDETIDADLNETQYIIEMDNRLGSLCSSDTGTAASISYIDDDNIASYYVSLATDRTSFLKDIPAAVNNGSSIRGPGGTTLRFKIQASTELRTSTYLFEKLGSTGPSPQGADGTPIAIRYIDTIIKVTGATTGYRLDIPVRYIKDNR
jgi:hypothetical protein